MRFDWRLWAGMMFAMLIAVGFSVQAFALETVVIPEDTGALDLSEAVEIRSGVQGRIQLSTAPDDEGIIRRIEVVATGQSPNPVWALIALSNRSDVQLERLLVAPHFKLAGSGVFIPDLGGARIHAVTPGQGFRPQRVPDREADVFSLTIDPGATTTLVFELVGDSLPDLQLWQSDAYAGHASAFTFFRGTLLGISSLLAVILSILFAVMGRGIFPAIAAFAWAVLLYLMVDFGLLGVLLELSPAQLQISRAIAEAALATTLFGFLFIYLNLHRWHLRFVHLALSLGLALAALMVLSFFLPVLAIGIARMIMAMVGLLGIVMVMFLAIRGYDRAIMLVPTWSIIVAWMAFTCLVLIGVAANDIVQSAVAGGAVLIVMLLGFTALQHTFTDVQINGKMSDVDRRALALTGSGDFVFDWHVQPDRVYVSEALARQLGENENLFHGSIKVWLDRLHPEDQERFRISVDTLVELKRGKISSEFRVLAHDGGYRHFVLRIKPVLGTNGDILRCIGTLHDVTEERVARERLMHDAVYDSLTGLPNRELLLDRLQRALSRSCREIGRKPSVFFLGLDNFSDLNARIGRTAADSVLLAIARRLARIMPPLDTLARVNEDRFAVILVSEQSARNIAHFAEQIRRAVREPIKLGDDELSVSASVGVTKYDNGPDTASAILRNSELAMLHAKRKGGDRIEAFRAHMETSGSSVSSMKADLEKAIDNDELQLFFQPIYDLTLNSLAGAEALVRWHHPDRGVVSPEEFVPLAERNGLIDRLGRLVFERAFTQLRLWLDTTALASTDFFVSINLSVHQLANNSLLTEMRSLKSSYGDILDRVVLEVTESQVMASPEHSAWVLDALKGMGLRLALDDFGVGHSSLSYLHRFPFDLVKIPSVFVQSGDGNGIYRTQLPIMKAVIALAGDLDLHVIAEGAENADEVERLRLLKCRYAQGFALSRPLTGTQIHQLIKDSQNLS